jgi:hypothetical protein
MVDPLEGTEMFPQVEEVINFLLVDHNKGMETYPQTEVVNLPWIMEDLMGQEDPIMTMLIH